MPPELVGVFGAFRGRRGVGDRGGSTGSFVVLLHFQALEPFLENPRECTCVHNITLAKVGWMRLHRSIPEPPDLKKEKNYKPEKQRLR